MPSRKVNVVITIQTENQDGTLSPIERWDIISTAAIATRAAIEQYLEPEDQQKAIGVAMRLLRMPARAKVTTRSMPLVCMDSPTDDFPEESVSEYDH